MSGFGRALGFVAGAVLAGCGIAGLALVRPLDWKAVLFGSALVVLGGESVWSAIRGRESWLMRIGPWP